MQSDGLKVAHLVDSIKIVDITGPLKGHSGYSLTDVDLNVQAYRLHRTVPLRQDGQSIMTGEEDEEASLRQASILTLPNVDLDGVWES